MDKSSRKAIIAGNWKMNKLASHIPAYEAELKAALPQAPTAEVALIVPFPLIPAMVEAMEDSPVKVGAQDVSFHKEGAYTGEVSASMLEDLGVTYCIIGHSERRAYHCETDEDIGQKLRALLEVGIAPILCVGESLKHRDIGAALPFVEQQIRADFVDVAAEDAKKVVVAYEPIWAIGTGRTATAEQAQEVCGYIRKVLGQMYGEETAKGMSILYGGSMNGKNAGELLAQPDIDGGLIGGASLKPVEFASIVEQADQ